MANHTRSQHRHVFGSTALRLPLPHTVESLSLTSSGPEQLPEIGRATLRHLDIPNWLNNQEIRELLEWDVSWHLRTIKLGGVYTLRRRSWSGS
ncbi:hypothetical protein FA95DRAFT_1564644 [Auriscalpium vulgare]|uniref:Uncharacterized protein n=1 Tax=Auriscalpium vulgare TaxID=40419 RepID=A0ACB8REU6_9AGAM|nr:hypothetical protein FA95DRAFT_1564644 [Auriscalpium vulgare]